MNCKIEKINEIIKDTKALIAVYTEDLNGLELNEDSIYEAQAKMDTIQRLMNKLKNQYYVKEQITKNENYAPVWEILY